MCGNEKESGGNVELQGLKVAKVYEFKYPGSMDHAQERWRREHK